MYLMLHGIRLIFCTFVFKVGGKGGGGGGGP